MIFAIAEQAPGHVKFSVGVEAASAPHNLHVTNNEYDENSQLTNTQDAEVGGWFADNGLWVGYASFAVAGGRPCFAFVHKGGTERPLGTFSYVAE